jgi:transposase
MVARRDRGYDAGKKINRTKRHLAVDTGGLLLAVLVTAASIQDRDAARPLLWNLRQAFPQIRLAWADGGYAGKLVTWAKTALSLALEIVKRPDDLHTFKVLPRRWVVERTLAWITRHRRTVRDYERLGARHETYVYWAMIIVMTRRLARAGSGTSSAIAVPCRAPAQEPVSCQCRCAPRGCCGAHRRVPAGQGRCGGSRSVHQALVVAMYSNTVPGGAPATGVWATVSVARKLPVCGSIMS